MTPLEEFLQTCFVAPGEEIAVPEFHSRFLDWLRPGQRALTARELGSALPNYRELFRGNKNVLTIADISFTKPYQHEVRQEIVDLWQPRVKFVDQEIGYVFFDFETWRRMKPQELCNTLALYKVWAHESYVIKAAARANPVRLTDLLSTQK